MDGDNCPHRESITRSEEVGRVARSGSPGFSAAALRGALDRASLSIEEFADSIGVTRQAVSAWLAGTATPAPASLVRAADVLNIAPADLTPHTAASAHVGDLRVQAGFTQAALSKRLGIAASAMSDIERGRRPVDDHLVRELGRVLGVADVEIRQAWERGVQARERVLRQRNATRRRGNL